MSLSGRTVLIVLGGHLASSPRSQKEAATLRAAGMRVCVRGAWFDEALAQEDTSLARSIGVDFAPVADARPGARGRFRLRTRQRLARELYTRLGIATPALLGMGPELLREARQLNCDVTMTHGEVGLWVGRRLLEEGRAVCADFEDWYSRDLLEEDRRTRPLRQLVELERWLLRRANCCFAATEAMAGALAADAQAERIPTVLPNCFPSSERIAASKMPGDPRPGSDVSFYWFSQTIGPGRGLETLALALPRLKGGWRLCLRGNLRTHGNWYSRTFPEAIRYRVQILEPVSNLELLARNMSHDVGLALDVPFCDSRDLTATNKIFEYLRAGLAVIATRTRGQEDVFRATPDVGVLVSASDADALASAMQRLIDSPAELTNARNFAHAAGSGEWDWSRFAPRIQDSVERVLAA